MNNCPANQFGCGCRDMCRAKIATHAPSYSRAPEYLAIVGIILSAALGIYAGCLAMDRVERAYVLEARV